MNRAEAAESFLGKFVESAKKNAPQAKKMHIENKKNNNSEDIDLGQLVMFEKPLVPNEEYSVTEIEEAAEFASSVTGVRKDFLMGMLMVESGLGKNVGKCTYQEIEAGAEKAHKSGRLSARAWQTFQERRDVIKDIAGSLNYDYEKVKVSCNPPYAGTGGAMGIPQFMPDTWLEYKDRIAAVTKKTNPDPWDVKDGVVAMALKVSDVPGVTQHSRLAERNAAKLYLSGNTSSRYDWYANQIFYWAENYDKIVA